MKTIDFLFRPYDEGKNIIIHTGRDLRDFTIDENQRITPLIEMVRKEALKRNMVLIQYSRSSGISFDSSSLSQEDTRTVNNVLRSLGLNRTTSNAENDNNAEFVQLMRGLLKLVQSREYPKFRDGRKMSFMFIIEFAEHNAPNMQPGFLTPDQIVSIELASKLSKSLGLRKSGCYVIFSEAREGTLNKLLSSHIEVLRLHQPKMDDKRNFLSALKVRYPEAKLEVGLTDDVILNITTNSPNRGLEQIFFSSVKTGKIITAADLYRKKQDDIIRISEGTLEAVDTARILNQKLVGKNVERPLKILAMATNALKQGKKGAIRNIILAGAPSTGKTHMATYAAALSKIQAFMLNSPKGSYVGESERKTKLMLTLLKEQRGVGIIDEIEKVLPMNSGDLQRNLDSGVSQNLMGQLQTFLSDTSLSGKVALFATSNKPGSISAAMLSRWNVVPVLMPLKEDYPEIVRSIFLSKMTSEQQQNFYISDSDLLEISNRFYYSGASARDINDSIDASFAFFDEEISIKHLEFASKTVVPSSDRISYIHSDLMALKFTKNYGFLPWWDIANNKPYDDYNFPDYVAEVLDEHKMIDQIKLAKKLKELEPYANV